MTESQPSQRISTLRVFARGEDYRVVRVTGNLFVCSRLNGSCCCGWEEKGRMPFANELWSEEWERRRIRNRLHLTFTGCLGPCIAGNNAMLQVHGRSIWLKDLNSADIIPKVFDYAEEMISAGKVLPPPDDLEGHVYDRYLVPSGEDWLPMTTEADDGGGLDRLDPVCLMDVDPQKTKHTVEYGGRVIAFCAPACKKQFLANPAEFALTQ